MNRLAGTTDNPLKAGWLELLKTPGLSKEEKKAINKAFTILSLYRFSEGFILKDSSNLSMALKSLPTSIKEKITTAFNTPPQGTDPLLNKVFGNYNSKDYKEIINVMNEP